MKLKIYKKTKYILTSNRFPLMVVAGLGVVLLSVVTIWIAGSQYVIYDGISKVAYADGTPTDIEAVEGTDTRPVTLENINNYSVPPDQPKRLIINSLGINARLMEMGRTADNSVEAPINIYDGGWFQESAKPGGLGAVLIDGHASSDGSVRDGLFGNLKDISIGDTVSVEVGDGRVFSYLVVDKAVVSLYTLNMNQVLSTYDGADRGLNLITCAGDWIRKGHSATLDKRVIVYTLPM